MTEHHQLTLPSYGRGFHLITHELERMLPSLPEAGILHLFIQHTSAALTINENADPSVRFDLQNFFDKLVRECDPSYTHVYEGDDDMPAHIKAAIIGSSLSIPIINGRLALGTWQGIYLCEFRARAGRRTLLASIIS